MRSREIRRAIFAAKIATLGTWRLSLQGLTIRSEGSMGPEQKRPWPASIDGDVLDIAQSWLQEQGKVLLATVASTWGSAPVPVGGQMVVASQDCFHGSVSGGCVETDVIAEATDAMTSGAPKLLAFGVDEETAWRAGLPCGGKIEILLEPLTRERDAVMLDRILETRRRREPLAVGTEIATGAPGGSCWGREGPLRS
jgi:XdhC/CoxI family protein